MAKKSKLKGIIACLLAATVVAGGVTAGSLAFLNDTDYDTNVMTLGNVDIEQYEKNADGTDFTQGQALYPVVGDANKIDKIVTVKNTGKSDAYVRTLVAFEMGGLKVGNPENELDFNEMINATYGADWTVNQESGVVCEIGNKFYYVVEAVYNNILPVGNETTRSLNQVWMADSATNKTVENIDGNGNGKYDVLVLSQAVQTAGFAATTDKTAAQNALDTAFAEVNEANKDEVASWFAEMVAEDGSFKDAPLVVANDAELAALLDDIENPENKDKYWNKPITINLAAGTYSGDHEIYQYPEWNRVVGHGTGGNLNGGVAGANYTNITFKGVGNVKFTGNVTVRGFGNAQTGFSTATTGKTAFENVTFDGSNSVEANGTDKIAFYANAAANNLSFEGCTFQNATHVTLGARGSDAVGKVSFDNCTFNDGGCLSGYVETLNVTNSKVTAASNGFINNAKTSTVTVSNCDITAGKYFLRTDNSGVHATVKDSRIVMYESEGKKDLVNFRGSSESATFTGCAISAGYGKTGVDPDSVLNLDENANASFVAISTADELFNFAEEVNENGATYAGKTVVLTADIDLQNKPWTPIGQTGATEFKGTFDGNGHTISNLNIDSSAQTGKHYSSGLFGWAEGRVSIKNVNVDGATVKGNHNVAVIVGYTYSGQISNCHVTNATITAKHANDDACGDKCGLIAGYAGNESRFTDCSVSNSTVTAGRDAGQLIGTGYNVSVSNGSATNVTVTAGGDCTGANINASLIGRVMG